MLASVLKIVVIIPALDEAGSIGGVVSSLFNTTSNLATIQTVLVVDNNSKDSTAAVAKHSGAIVVQEERQGYGAACLRGIQELLAEDFDCFLFIDADGSDLASEWPLLAEKLIQKDLDFVLGSRIIKKENTGLLFHQRLGNLLVAGYLRIKYNLAVTDLAPYRLIRKQALLDLNMQDQDFGWTIEMQIKAARSNLKTQEVAVTNQPRVTGRSKISGTIKGTFLAAKIISSYVLKDLFMKKIQ